ncbi:MAG: OadG family protein [Oscillospiraceae bacterium]|nr:OadG family protein [Oscillospiraceae bacterium]MDD4413689.1 OadG family protein [Oscillospiraceae bacterium]
MISFFTASKLNILSQAGMVIVIGLVVVFLTLILLTAIFWLFGKIMHGKSNSSKENSGLKPHDEKAKKHSSLPSSKITSCKPATNNGLSDEVVAVIAAAVAAMTPDGARYSVRSIRRVNSERSVWAAAGLAESTRPF